MTSKPEKDIHASYFNTFIRVADDCPVSQSEIPAPKNDNIPAHAIQYDLLMRHPYTFDHKNLIWEVCVAAKGLCEEVLEKDGDKIKEELFSKGQPCLRASAPTKRYGFGAHYNSEGKIALYTVESEKYKAFLADKNLKQLAGMRTKRSSE